MRTNNIRKLHGVLLDKMNIPDGIYEQRVEALIQRYLEACKQIHRDEYERFERELHKLKTERTN